MKLNDARILLTGAAGGIASAIAREVGQCGAELLLADLDQTALDELVSVLSEQGTRAEAVAANITVESDVARLIERAREARINVLINAAGLNPFGFLEEQLPEQISLAIQVNVLAPILLCRAMIPILRQSESAQIINIGSSFGSIGFPAFAAYSASKFALRGFTEALRRELSDTSIGVHYVAPRATQTRLATDKIKAMNQELRVGMDTPEVVAKAVVRMMREQRRELSLGLPERLYAKINGLFPGIIDLALSRQLPTIRRYATQAKSGSQTPTNLSTRMEVMETNR